MPYPKFSNSTWILRVGQLFIFIMIFIIILAASMIFQKFHTPMTKNGEYLVPLTKKRVFCQPRSAGYLDHIKMESKD